MPTAQIRRGLITNSEWQITRTTAGITPPRVDLGTVSASPAADEQRDEHCTVIGTVRIRPNELQHQLPRARRACHGGYAADGRRRKCKRQACSRSAASPVRPFRYRNDRYEPVPGMR